jgi:hypothetical protein
VLAVSFLGKLETSGKVKKRAEERKGDSLKKKLVSRSIRTGLQFHVAFYVLVDKSFFLRMFLGL